MGGKKSREKGDRAERKVVEAFKKAGLKAQRIPLSGSAGGEFTGDVWVGLGIRPYTDGLTLEVKSRKSPTPWKQLTTWLAENDGLVLCEDRKPPLVLLRLEDLTYLMGLMGDKLNVRGPKTVVNTSPGDQGPGVGSVGIMPEAADGFPGRGYDGGRPGWDHVSAVKSLCEHFNEMRGD